MGGKVMVGSLFGLAAVGGGGAVLYNKTKKGEIKPDEIIDSTVKVIKNAFNDPDKTLDNAIESTDKFLTTTGEIIEHPIDAGKKAAGEALGLGNGSDIKNAFNNPWDWVLDTFTKTLENGETEIDTTKAVWTAIPIIGSFLFAKNFITPDTPEHNTNWTKWMVIAATAFGLNSYKEEISSALNLDKLDLGISGSGSSKTAPPAQKFNNPLAYEM